MIRTTMIASFLALAAVAIAIPASAGEPWVEQRLLAEDGQAGDLFGFRVLVSGDTAFVGAPATGFGLGEVHVFERTNGVWSLTQVLTATPGETPPPNWSDFFGWSLSFSGDTLLVGAPQRFDPLFGPIGAGYVFTQSDGRWTQQQELLPNPIQSSQWFGSSVAVDGDTAVIGSHSFNGSIGTAYVFAESGGTWSLTQQLSASDGGQPGAPRQFGQAVALDGPTMLIGAPGPDWSSSEQPPGGAYVFTFSEGSWTETQKLSGAGNGDQFGFAVALSGTTALVGAPQQTVDEVFQQGAVYAFGESGGTWTEEQQLTLDAGEEFDQFGQSVALQGDTALIGEWSQSSEPGGTPPPPKEGRAHLFTRSEGTWSLIQELTPNDGVVGDSFGWHVAVDGSTLLVGATAAAPGGNTFQGAAYAFFMPPADHGIFQGTVQSLGYCGANPAPLAGATVEIAGGSGTATFQAQENGFYQASLPASDSPVDIAVSAPGHLPSTVEGVVFGEGETVVHDFQLDLAAPCATAEPSSFALELQAGGSTTETLTLGNVDGHADLEWSVTGTDPLDSHHGAAEPVAENLVRSPMAPQELGPIGDLSGMPNARRLTAARDLASVSHPLPSVRPLASAGGVIDCEGEPEIIVHDDGTVEEGYSANPDTVSEVRFADRFTPLAYPTPLTAVCLAFVTQGPTSLDFDIVVYDDDGPGGGPGTELGTLPVTADGIPSTPGTPAWFSFDISSLDVTVASGSVYIGARWTPANPGVFIAADESGPNPPGFAGGYWWNDLADAWMPIEEAFANYRSLFVRTVASSGGCVDPTEVAWLSLDPASGVTPAGGSSEVQVGVDTGELSPGTYEASLCVANNDAQRPLVVIPVTLTVGAGNFSPLGLEVDPPGLTPGANGIFEPGESVDVAPSWHNDSGVAQSLGGTASAFTGPAGATYTIDLGTADYGPVEPGEAASCFDTEVCYRLGLDDPAARPAAHWDATFDEILDDDAGTTQTWTLHIGASFDDVPTTSPFYPTIETLLHSGITGGCAAGAEAAGLRPGRGPDLNARADGRHGGRPLQGGAAYCPGGANSRAQMPVFMLRALMGSDYTPPPCVEGNDPFGDVPFDNTFCPWIQDLANRGIVSGCGGGDYCPGDAVTRAQMAIFLLKTLEGAGYEPAECTERFTDVPCPSLFADWIEDLAARGITGGCTATEYCPGDAVTRAQMAVFVTRTFGLTLYGP